MKKRAACLTFCLLAIMTCISSAGAEDLNSAYERWRLSGANMTRYEWYDNNGDSALSPYRFEGDQFHNDLSLNLSRRLSPYELLDVRLTGTYNDSDYRGKKGGVLEGGALMWEKGDAAIPFRITAGDFFASTSDRTIQRSLKGGLIELQPSSGLKAGFHSIQIFSGFVSPTYHEFDVEDDYYNGGSWLVEYKRFGSLLLSVTHNYRQSDDDLSLSSRDQAVLSAAYEKDVSIAGQDLTLELEFSQFDGQLPGASSGDDENKSEGAVYTKLQGKSASLPLRYQVAYEQYGPDFQPNGAVVGPDQRRYYGNADWNFGYGGSIEGRYQRYEDSVESANPTDTDTYGIRYSGPLLRSHMQGGTVFIDAFTSRAASDDGSTDTETYAAQGRISLPVTEGLTSHINGAARTTKDRTAGEDTSEHQLVLSIAKYFSYNEINGSITPSWIVRFVTGPGRDQDTHYPAFALAMSYRNHDLQFSHGYNFQDSRESSGTDITSQRTSLNYSYQRGPHSFNIYGDRFERNPEPGEGTRSYRLGALYTFSFDTLLGRPERGRSTAVPAYSTGPVSIADLAPGRPLADAQKLLSSSGAAGPVILGDLMVYEMTMFDGPSQGQRLAIRHRNGRIASAWLIIDGGSSIDHLELRESYDAVRSELIRLLGQPYEVLEKGAFTEAIQEDIASRNFIRITEWNTGEGVIRMGIPERLDGRVRVEVVYSQSQVSPLKKSTWGLEEFQ